MATTITQNLTDTFTVEFGDMRATVKLNRSLPDCLDLRRANPNLLHGAKVTVVEQDIASIGWARGLANFGYKPATKQRFGSGDETVVQSADHYLRTKGVEGLLCFLGEQSVMLREEFRAPTLAA